MNEEKGKKSVNLSRKALSDDLLEKVSGGAVTAAQTGLCGKIKTGSCNWGCDQAPECDEKFGWNL